MIHKYVSLKGYENPIANIGEIMRDESINYEAAAVEILDQILAIDVQTYGTSSFIIDAETIRGYVVVAEATCEGRPELTFYNLEELYDLLHDALDECHPDTFAPEDPDDAEDTVEYAFVEFFRRGLAECEPKITAAEQSP